MPRRAEINQRHLPRRGQKNVVGTDVSVQKSCGVHRAQRIHDRQQNSQHFFKRHGLAAAAHQVLLERDAFQVVHHQVGRAVFGEKIAHADNIRGTVKARQRARLLQKGLQAVGKALGAIAGKRNHHVAARRAGSAVLRKIFLNGKLDAQHLIPRDIGRAEPAVAQTPPDEIFSRQHGSRTKIMRGQRRRTLAIAAIRADFRVPLFLHTAKTD